VAKAGHVMTARVSATLEVHVRDFEAEIQRGMVPEIGLNLWQL
jgi:predicted DNA-binding protein with PD1-like motif